MLPFADESRACRISQQAWSRLPLRDRLAPVARFRRLLVSAADRLCETVQRDIGRLPDEVLATDVLPTADACRFLQRNATNVLRPRHISLLDRPLWLFGERSTVYRRAHGVVGIIGTWNYPIYLNAIQILQALTAGNGVLWKPSELMPACPAQLQELFQQAGYPPDLLRTLPATREAGSQLADADVDHVVFTGSASVGRKLAARLGERLVSSTLELSGCDAMFVMADADVPLAARAAWFGTTLNNGQTCLAVRRIFVQESVYAAFLQALEPLAMQARPVPLVLESQVKQAEQLVAQAVAAGARPLANGNVVKSEIFPTIVCDAKPDMAICREAAFAPIAAVLPFTEVEDALRMDAQCGYALGASIFSANTTKAQRLAARLGPGLVTINDTLAAAAHPATPFGGRGASGWGSTQGAEGLLAMTVPQAVSVRSGNFRPHYDPVAAAPHVAGITRGVLELTHGTWRQRWTGLKRVLRQLPRFVR
ncbi:MAG: aldehyde dehydrogenase family protein [Gemmataceae bacterium]